MQSFRSIFAVRRHLPSFVLAVSALTFACTAEVGSTDPADGSPTGSGGLTAAGGSSSSGDDGAVPGSGGWTDGTTGEFAAIADLIGRSCSTALCHGKREEPAFGNNSALHGFLSTTLVEECGNVPLVQPGDPANSALLKLIKRECIDDEGKPFFMPDNCRRPVCLPDDDVATLTEWIAAGAPP